MAKHVVIPDRQGNHTASVFLKESFRPVVLLWSYICIYGRLVDSNTMASPILHLTPLDFNFWGHTKDLVYEVEINTKGQLQKRVTDVANQIRKNSEMLNSVYENWYRRTQMCINANGMYSIHYFGYLTTIKTILLLHSSSTILHTLPLHLFTH
jgi:hypothetical protein